MIANDIDDRPSARGTEQGPKTLVHIVQRAVAGREEVLERIEMEQRAVVRGSCGEEAPTCCTKTRGRRSRGREEIRRWWSSRRFTDSLRGNEATHAQRGNAPREGTATPTEGRRHVDGDERYESRDNRKRATYLQNSRVTKRHERENGREREREP